MAVKSAADAIKMVCVKKAENFLSFFFVTEKNNFQIVARNTVSKDMKQILLMSLKGILEKVSTFQQTETASAKIQLISQLKNLQNLLQSEV